MRSQHGVPAELVDRLAGLQHQLRKLLWIRGLSLVVILLVVGLGLALLVDLQWELSPAVRSVLLAGLALLGLITLARTAWKMRRLQLSQTELAAIVEAAHPELSERLTSTLELNDPELPEAHRGSRFMRSQLLGQTLTAVETLAVEQSVTPHRASRTAVLAALMFLLAWLPWIFAPQSYQLLLGRLFVPWGNHASVGQIYFEVESGDRVVARGADVRIAAAARLRVASAKIPDDVRLNWTADSAVADSRTMAFDRESQSFVTTIPHVFESFAFHIASDSSRSRSFRVEVVDAPQITRCTLDIEPPAYMGLPAVRNDGGAGRIEVFEHSRVTCRLEFNKRVERVEWLWDAPQQTALSAVADSDTTRMLTATLAQDRMSAELEFDARRGGRFEWRVTDGFGLNNPQEPEREIDLKRDQPPVLQLAGKSATRTVAPSDVVPVQVTAADDVGLGALELHIAVDEKQRPVIAVDPQLLGVRRLDHKFQMDLSEMGLPAGSIVVYRVRAADERLRPGPQEVWSDPRSLHVQPNAQPWGVQELADEQDAIRKQLEQVRQQLAANRRSVEEVQRQAASDVKQSTPFERDADLPPLATKQVTLARDLEALHGVMAGHVLYASLMDAAREVAREHLPESSKLISEAVDSALELKTGLLADSVEQLRTAERKLGGLSEAFESLADLEQDLLELNRLANQAERLANKTLELQKQRDRIPEDLTPLDQQSRLEDLQQQQQLLQQQQQQLSSRLNDLLERRPELVDAARQHNLDRLAELSKAALDLVEPEDLLAESMRAEASRSAGETAPLIEELEQLQQDVAGLEQELARHPHAAELRPVDTDALRQAIEELKAGNLNAAGREIGQGADEIAEVARQIEEMRNAGGDPQQRLSQLAEKQAGLQQRLADAARNRPPDTATDDQRREFSNKLRKLAADQVALQAGLAEMTLPRQVASQQQQAVQQAGDAVQSLLKQDETAAAKQAQQVHDDIKQLAKAVGDEPQRRARAAKALAGLREQQAELNTQVAQHLDSQPKPTPDPQGQWGQEQDELSQELAQLDLPGNARSQAQALENLVRAARDLKQGRWEAADAGQRQAEQSLADLQKAMAGKPTPAQTVPQLQQRQTEVAQQAESATTADQRRQLAEDQRRIAQQLQTLDVPVAEPQQAAAVDAAKQAAKSLDDNSDSAAMRGALERADQALQDLAAGLQPQIGRNSQEQTRQLAQRQAAASQAAAQREKSKQPPSADSRRQARNESQQILEQTQGLPAAEPRRAAKTAALDALRNTRRLQDQIEQTAKKRESAAKQPTANPQLEQLLKQEARSQQQAAQALNQLAETPTPQTADSDRAAQQEANRLQKQSVNSPQQMAQEATRLADDLQRLRQRTAQVDPQADPAERAAEMAEVAEQQQAVRDRARQLPANQQSLERAETIRDLNRAVEAAQAAEPQQAAQAQQSAEQRLRRMAQAAQDVARGQTRPFTAAPPQDPVAQQAADVAQSERQLQERIRRQRQPDAASPANANASTPPAVDAAADVAQQQQQLARQALELALQAAQQQGPESNAAQTAASFARRTAETGRRMQAGQLAAAGQHAQQAAQNAAEARRALQQAGSGATEMAERAGTLAEQQHALSQRMQQLSKQPEQRVAAQAAGQNQLAQQASQLSQQLADTARQLQAQPLDLPQSGQQAQKTQQAVEQARQAMRDAADQIQQGNAQHAAQSAQQASQALRQAAESQQPAGQGAADSAVPGEFAQMIAEAAQHLQQAGEQLADGSQSSEKSGEANAGKPDASASGAASGAASAQPGSSANSKSTEGTPGQNAQPGGQSSQGLANSAESMRQAAQALAQAAQQVQPGQSKSEQTAQNQPSPDGESGAGADAPVDLSDLDSELQRLSQREWGRLPGSLRTEILQAAGRKPNSDYAPLIKFYFQQIARKQQSGDDKSPPR